MSKNIEQSIVQFVVVGASAAVGFAGFGLVFVDSPGPLWPTIFATLIAVTGSCLLTAFSPGKWLLIAVLCSWGAAAWTIVGVLMQQPKLRYLMLTLPLAVAAAYIGSRIGRANRHLRQWRDSADPSGDAQRWAD